MQARDLINYINDPGLLDKGSVSELQKLTDQFPYFQSAHLLLSMASKKWDAAVFQQSLKKTAIVATNRTHLFNLIRQVETANLVEEISIPAAVPKPDQTVNKIETGNDSAKQELDILKATEASAESTENDLYTKNSEEVVEKEIARQVVVSFVEKEILKTPQVHVPPSGETAPDNFADWLRLLKKNNGQPYHQIDKEAAADKNKHAGTPEKISKKEKNKALIDKIIESNPGHIRVKEEQKFYTPDVKAKESLLENEHLVTETLAKIYALQGNMNKAIRAYEILSLKFPQKSAYFASLIQKLKNN